MMDGNRVVPRPSFNSASMCSAKINRKINIPKYNGMNTNMVCTSWWRIMDEPMSSKNIMNLVKQHNNTPVQQTW